MGTLWCQAGKEERKRGENNDDPRTGRPERRENGRKKKKTKTTCPPNLAPFFRSGNKASGRFCNVRRPRFGETCE